MEEDLIFKSSSPGFLHAYLRPFIQIHYTGWGIKISPNTLYRMGHKDIPKYIIQDGA